MQEIPESELTSQTKIISQFAKSFPLPKNLPLISIAMTHQRMCFSIEHEKTDS